MYGCGSEGIVENMCRSVAVLLVQAMLCVLRVWTDTQAASGASFCLSCFQFTAAEVCVVVVL